MLNFFITSTYPTVREEKKSERNHVPQMHRLAAIKDYRKLRVCRAVTRSGERLYTCDTRAIGASCQKTERKEYN